MTLDDCIDFDRELCTKKSTFSDKDIIREVLNYPVEDSSHKDNNDAGAAEMKKPSMKEVKSAIEMLEKFSLHSNFSEDIMKPILQVRHIVEREEQTKLKQENIDLFKKIDKKIFQ